MRKPKIYVLSFSGGKDSTKLLMELIRRKCPLDLVIFFDTGWEFFVMYEHIEKCKKICETNGIKFVTLYPEKSFDYLMFDKEVEERDGGGIHYGYSWCGGSCRWGTTEKTKAIKQYIKQFDDVIVYVGIASDEKHRLEKEWAEYKRFPLVDWNITERECLLGCYEDGFTWGGMYKYLDRLSCKYCANKNNKELKNIRDYYPDEWEALKSYQRKTDRPYRSKGVSVFDIERRFEVEDEFIAQGKKLRTKEFFNELKARGINY